MRKVVAILAVLASMATTATAWGHAAVSHRTPFSKMTLAQIERYQVRVIKLDRWVIRTAAVHKPSEVWWHKQQLKWTTRELKETRARLRPAPAHYSTGMSTRTATWYGPHFYGHRTSCGQTMSESAVWIAVDSVSCGTRITICYHGRCIRTSVQDGGGAFDMAAGLAKYLCGCSSPYTMKVQYRYG